MKPRARALRVLLAALLVALVVVPTGTSASAAAKKCRLFPRSSFWYADVSDLPVHTRSDAWLDTIGTSRNIHPNFFSGTWQGHKVGLPINRVGRNKERVNVSFRYENESDPGKYPIPANPKIENGKNSTGDRHVLVLQKSRCRLFELFNAHPTGNGNWTAGSGAKYNLRSNKLRPDGWTSADASGLPMTPGLVRYWEVAKGDINHVIRISAPVTQKRHVWPARHDAGTSSSKDAPPMGAWLRLSSDIDPADFPPQARVVVEALQTHGAIIVDNSSNLYLSGVPHKKWDDADLLTLRTIQMDDFEFVQSGLMKVWPNSMKVKAEYRG